jgi:sugar phosphate isomerase/epimerase
MCSGHDDTASREEVARLSRRGFLRTAAATAAVVGASSALAAPALAGEDPGGSGGRGRHRVPRDQISIQLFTLRDQLAIDLEGTLAALADIGYTRVEHAGFVGRTVEEFKAALDAAGLWASSGHVQIPQPFDPAAWSASLADANTLGSRYIVHPFFGINFGTGEVVRETAPWRAFARDLNRAGRMARDAGLKLGYHNHNWEFFRLTDDPSRTAYDVLTDTTDPDLVHLELDLFWATRGARDPVDLIRQNRGRVLQYHVKDMNQAGSFEDPGQGLIDFARIFRHSREAGVEEYIVERDDAGTPPREPADALDTARVGYQFLRTVRF